MKKMKLTLKRAFLLCLVLVSFSLMGCDKSKWRSKEFGGPPSWENDIGRPEGYGGVDPWR